MCFAFNVRIVNDWNPATSCLSAFLSIVLVVSLTVSITSRATSSKSFSLMSFVQPVDFFELADGSFHCVDIYNALPDNLLL